MNARRDWMRQVLGSAILFAPSPWAYVWAQGGAGQGAQVLKLPKIALLIGNAAYRQSPLRNPVNDALGMAATLNAAGFEVTVRLDAFRVAMQSALDIYVKQLATRKCVGLFYFAGHGVQFNWKNYLLPVDAQVASNDDVQRHGIEVNALAAGLARAGNPMNLVILDACRDAPFGEAGKPDQKGLSQMDAPAGTLLAYATAPGNVASDGEGANGLYTENLLREARVPEARVEDVFKRVRLNVRRRSNGLQVPWESTSLEEDFYFVAPAGLGLAPDAARVSRFAAELRLWESIAQANEPAPFDEYLKRHPEGQFTDLARSRRESAVALQARLREEDRQRLVAAEAAAWQRAGAAAGLPEIEAFLLKYPAGANGQAARARRDQLVAEREAKLLAATPQVPTVRTEQDRERRYAVEARLWENAERASVPGPLEDYLRRYPSGYFAELAQFRLDRLLAQAGEMQVVIPSQKGNPYSAGTQRTDTAFRVGDTWTYRVTDVESGKVLRTARRTVTAITDSEIHINNGLLTWDLMGNLRKRADGFTEVGAQYMPTELAVGRSWISRHELRSTNQAEPHAYINFQFRVAAYETVTVPAGSFECFRIEGKGVRRNYFGASNAQLDWVRWMAPERSRLFVKQNYALEAFGRGGPPTRQLNERFELVSFRQA